MGQRWFDQYSLLHFATGIFAYFWGFSWLFTLISHILFEILENTEAGMHFINTKFPWWPGGKPKADSIPNQISDTIMTMLGWFASRYADSLSDIYHLYPG